MAFANLRSYLLDRHGPEVLAAVLERAPGRAGRELQTGMLSVTAWYPVSELAGLYDRCVEVTGAGLTLPFEAGRAAMKGSVPVIFRMFLRILSPELVVRRAMSIFRRFYDGGGPRVIEHGPQHVVVRFTGCHGFTRLLWEDIRGATHGTLEVAGAKGIAVSFAAGGAEGDSEATLEASWR